MRKTLIIATAALVVTLGACQKKERVETAPPVVETAPADPNAVGADDVGLTELPGSQAEMIAQAGSDSVYFGTDEHDLDEPARTTLAAQARWLTANPTIRASIEGHADERGTREYNIALGERRANAARTYLVGQGIAATRLTVISWGKERPVAQGSDESAWAQNRRSVTVLVR